MPQLLLRQQRLQGKRYKPKRVGRIIYPHMETLTYQGTLGQVPQAFSAAVERRIIPMLPVIVASSAFSQIHDARTDDLDDLLEGAQADAAGEFNDLWIQRQAQEQGQKVSAFNRRQLTAKLSKALGIGIWFDDPWYQQQLKSFAADNVSLIKGATLRQKADIKNVILQGIRSGRRVEDLAEDVRARFGVAENRAKLIARDQTAMLFGNMNMLRQTEVGILTYFWRTMEDERVRFTHEQHDGLEYEWRSPPPDTGHPGDDYQCRCTAEPNLRYSAFRSF